MAASIRDFKKKMSGEKAASENAVRPDPSGRTAEEIAAQYSGRSEGELMRELLRVTDEQKKDGSFDRAGMHRTAESIMPMLTSEQAEKLKRIMDMLG